MEGVSTGRNRETAVGRPVRTLPTIGLAACWAPPTEAAIRAVAQAPDEFHPGAGAGEFLAGDRVVEPLQGGPHDPTLVKLVHSGDREDQR